MSYLNALGQLLGSYTAQLDGWLQGLHPHMAGVDSGQLLLIGAVSLVGAKFMCVGTGGR